VATKKPLYVLVAVNYTTKIWKIRKCVKKNVASKYDSFETKEGKREEDSTATREKKKKNKQKRERARESEDRASAVSFGISSYLRSKKTKQKEG